MHILKWNTADFHLKTLLSLSAPKLANCCWLPSAIFSIFLLSFSPLLCFSTRLPLSVSLHLHTFIHLHGFSLLPVLQEKKAVPQTRSLFSVLFRCTLIQSLFCICAHYSFTIFSCLLPFFTTNWYNVAVPVFSVVSVLHVFSVIFGQLY